MIKVTYHDREQAAPVVTFHKVQFKHDQAVEVPADWSGLELVRGHPFFSVEGGHDKTDGTDKPDEPPRLDKTDKTSEPLPAISIGEARAWGRDAYVSGHHRKAPAHYSAAQRKAWLEGFDRARRKARQ
jgi:hypothetical protein